MMRVTYRIFGVKLGLGMLISDVEPSGARCAVESAKVVCLFERVSCSICSLQKWIKEMVPNGARSLNCGMFHPLYRLGGFEPSLIFYSIPFIHAHMYACDTDPVPFETLNGCGSKMGTQKGTLANEDKD